MTPYEYGDAQVAKLKREIMVLFRKAMLMRFDEINSTDTAKVIRRIYRTIGKRTRVYLEDLVDYIWFTVLEEHNLTLDERAQARLRLSTPREFVDAYLSGYDPVTKYVYDHELDRKRARLFESLIADRESDNPTAIDTDYIRAQKLVTGQTEQYFIDVEDAARNRVYEAMGVPNVRWITEDDERVCEECGPMHGLVFPIDRIPPKPHPRCRCHTEPA